ncbi:MAG: sulfatase [Bacteroidota bacterium]
MRKINFIFILLPILGLSCQPTQSSNEATDGPFPYNILWIISDDLGIELGCYGNPLVHTPSIDQLATEGVLYENFFTVSPVCSPSRSAFITGLYPTQVQAHHHRTMNPQPLPDSIQILPAYFQEAGYFTFNQSGRDSLKAGKEDYNFQTDFQYDGTDWTQRQKGQPFFGQIQIYPPHRVFVADSIHPIPLDQVKLPPFYPDHPLARKDWALYLESVQAVDRKVRKIIERLKREGLYENTIIFFFGDHGRPHVWDKQFIYDGGIHAPLIIRHPAASDQTVSQELVSSVDLAPTTLLMANLKTPKYLSGQDFWQPEHEERPYIYAQRDRTGDAMDRSRTIRTKRYKYILNLMPEQPYIQLSSYKKGQYPVFSLLKVLHEKEQLTEAQALRMANRKPKIEFYDLVNDPYELNNLAYQANYAERIQTLSEIMDTCLVRYDSAYQTEPAQFTKAAKDASHQSFLNAMKSRGWPTDISDEALLKLWEAYLLK